MKKEIEKILKTIDEVNKNEIETIIKVFRIKTGIVFLVNGDAIYSVEFDEKLNRHYLFELSNPENIKNFD